jgi:hypothetical protein
VKEHDITNEGWPVAQLLCFTEYRVIDEFKGVHVPEVDKTAFREENDVPTRLHGEAIYLRLDIDHLLGVCFEPGYINLDIEMADTVDSESQKQLGLKQYRTYLLTIASSGMTSKCFAVIMSLLPVVVTKRLARGAASSIVVTSKPAIAACSALIGSISVITTRAPYERKDSAH